MIPEMDVASRFVARASLAGSLRLQTSAPATRLKRTGQRPWCAARHPDTAFVL